MKQLDNWEVRELIKACAWVLCLLIVMTGMYLMVSNTNHRRIEIARIAAQQ